MTVAELMRRDRCSYLTAVERLKNEPQQTTIRRKMWAVVFPDGRIVTGSDLHSEADAWSTALGWPTEAEIEDAKKRGAVAVEATLSYTKDDTTCPHCQGTGTKRVLGSGGDYEDWPCECKKE